MNVFFTGARGAGKSTALRAALAASGLRAAGLVTVFGPAPAGERRLYLAPFGAEPLFDERFVCARMDDAHGEKRADPAVFDGAGVRLLRAAAASAAELLVIDELGFLEAEAAGFRAAVLEALRGHKPVLGVVRQGFGAWEGAPLGTVLTVTPENRDALPARVAALLRG